MAGLLDRVRFNPTAGGTTDWTVSSAITGFQTPASAGVTSGRLYRYAAESADLAQWEIGEGIYSGGVLTRTRVRFNSSGGTSKINFSAIPQVGIVALAEDWAVLNPPQGKLTLTSGVPTMRTTVAAATSLIYTNAGSGTVPISMDAGSSFTNTAFAEMTQALTDATKSPAAAQPNANYDYYVWDDAGTLRCTRSDYWKKTATVTMTIASPCVVTWPVSAPADGTPVVLTTSGALPTGLTAGTTVYCKSPSGATSNLSATVGGAAINTSGSQSGVHTATYGDDTGAVARAAAGNCELDTAKTFLVNKNAITNGPAAGYGTYVGTVRTNSAGTVDQTFCSSAASFGAGSLGVWNAYNKDRVNIGYCADSTANSYATTNVTMNAAHNSATARVSFVRGLDVDPVELMGQLYAVAGASTAMLAGFGLDSTTTLASAAPPGWHNAGGNGDVQAPFYGLPGLGYHYLSLNEMQSTATASAWRTQEATSGSAYAFGFTGWMWL